jgi:acetyl esterase/lipase
LSPVGDVASAVENALAAYSGTTAAPHEYFDHAGSLNIALPADGTVHIPAFAVPLSSYMSEEAKKRFIDQAEQAKRRLIDQAQNPPDKHGSVLASITEARRGVDKLVSSNSRAGQSTLSVDIAEQKIGGVRTDIITPKDGVAASHSDRVLINLHGGGFQVGAVWGGMAESIPVSGVGKFKVITVDYRMAPEYKFPAASEELVMSAGCVPVSVRHVASVYIDLLKQYKPENIGIYGCSAGGMLTAMTVAWFQKEKSYHDLALLASSVLGPILILAATPDISPVRWMFRLYCPDLPLQ